MGNEGFAGHRDSMRRALLRGGACALALVVAACGGGSGGGGAISSTPPPPSPAPAPTPTPTPAPGPSGVTLTQEYRDSAGPAQHGAVAAWDAGSTGNGQTIAIIDTGIDASSPEFAGRILAASRDVANGGRSIQAEDDHGTNVALVAAAARDRIGVMGIAYNAPLLVLRADSPGTCSGTRNVAEASCSFSDSSIARGIDAAVAGGARVVNISLGAKDPITASVRDAVTRAAGAGVVIVVAAGNGGDDSRPGVDPNQPSGFASSLRAAGGDNVIIVGSVDEGNAISSFSQRAGAQASHFLTARGERVCCVYENGRVFVGNDGQGPYNLAFSGTSFATPQVAGAVALLAQAFPNLTGAQIVRILLDSARDAGAAGVDNVYGAGVLDIARAMAPRGTLTLPGGTTVVYLGQSGTGSPAMGDALGGGAAIGGVALDGYQRAYKVDLGAGLRGAAPGERLRGALATGSRVAGTQAGPMALAFTIANPRAAGSSYWARQLRLSGEQADGARLLAARAIARLTPGTSIALAVNEGAEGLSAQLRGASQPAFLIARAADGDTGFSNRTDTALAIRQQLGSTGLTFSATSGRVWRGSDLRESEALPGAVREPADVRRLTLTADRRLGPLATSFGATWQVEDATVLGALFPASFGARGADTLFLDAAAGLDLAQGWTVGAQWRQGLTEAHVGGLVTAGSRFASNGWSIDLSRANTLTAGGSLGFRLSQPLRVSNGGIGLRVPVAWDYATFSPTYGTQSLSLAPSGREIDAELAWHGPLWGGNAGASLFWRKDPGHYASLRNDRGVALRWERVF